ncbi:MAG: 7-cyano-7-deazaguanine synthase QueC [bacterium]
MKKAVILFSGGLDSTTVAALASEQGFDLYLLTVDYGQRHRVELERARKSAIELEAAQHKIIRLDLRTFGGSALTDEIEVPPAGEPGIPVTYVPARNTIFLSLALAWAEVLKAGDIFIGINCLDYSGYPDCRPEYIASFQKTAALATRTGVEGNRIRINTPLINLRKSDIIAWGTRLGVDYSHTFSCYNPDPAGYPCGCCDSCHLRSRGFKEAGLQDPLLSMDN